MKKNIWIMNHYATSMFGDKGGRHFWFAENLIKAGYKPTIFCANTFHNSNDAIGVEKKKKFLVRKVDDIPFVFVKTTTSIGNGFDRVKNMGLFAWNLISASKQYAKAYGKPDVILASSVHPLTLVAGILIAKHFGVRCICEVRDLWPESFVAYGILKENSIIVKILYQCEKWIYKKADAIIMTWAGGIQYIKDKKWNNAISLDKIHYITNGLDIDEFDHNQREYQLLDADLKNESIKKIVYTGSIRKVNNLGLILDVAEKIQDQDYRDIKFFIYGTGDELPELEKRLTQENIKNVVFKGRVDKKYIPYILSQADINLLHNTSTALDKYGQSQNKLFEYLAAGKCIVQTYTTGFSILDKYSCGVSVKKQSVIDIAEAIIGASKNSEECQAMGNRAREAAHNFDFKVHTEKLIEIIESL